MVAGDTIIQIIDKKTIVCVETVETVEIVETMNEYPFVSGGGHESGRGVAAPDAWRRLIRVAL